MALLTKIKSNQQGQGLIEIILAMAIFGLIAATLSTLVVGSLRALQQGGEQTEANALAQEGIEAIRSIRDGAWNEIIYSQSKVELFGGEWILSGEGTSETIGQYTRDITFSDVCRDGGSNIVTCPGAYTDVHTQQVTVTITWTIRTGITNSVQQVAYFSNWDSREWIEDLTAEFTDGTFSSTENSTTLGDADGAIILQAL